ncbi:MAG: SDR family oxidoreductase [Chloroflexi bacterium]|nr:MAG: SDR family oxidoreductase [Chloroflexota bacterium]
MTTLKGRVALVTGGARRVGKAIALALARAGAHVAVNSRRITEEARQTAAEIEALGVRTCLAPADVSQADQIATMVRTATEALGPITILVNSAASFQRASFEETTPALWEAVMAVNLTGPFLVTRAVVPGMRAAGGGVIVNISDLFALIPWPGYLAHGVAKAGLLALTRGLAAELAPTIRVNAVVPGPILPPPEMSPQRAQEVAQATLLQRWGSPEDVAQAVLYLAQADYVTGEMLVVDGGQRWKITG